MHPATPAGDLAGRDHELALLDGFLREPGRGGQRAVLIEGEAGVGKTALVRTAVSRVAPGCVQVFWGAGDELGSETPLLPFLDALDVRRSSVNARRTAIAGLLRGEVAAGREADIEAMLAEQLIALTIDEAAARPVVLVIDDLQWADPASVRLWKRLARTATEAPLLLIGLTRPSPVREDLLALRRSADGDGRLLLPALSAGAAAELTAALAGGRPDGGLARLADGAAGNPRYLTGLLAALRQSGRITVTEAGEAQLTEETVPDSVTASIAGQVGFLTPAAREVLQAAALLGVTFTVPDLITVLGRTVAEIMPALDEARASGLVSDPAGGTALAFRHPLVREALYAEQPAAVRGAWHRDAGQALAAAGASPDRVARQLLRALGGTEIDRIAVSAVEPPVQIERPPVSTGAAWPGGLLDQWMLDWLAHSADSLVGQSPAVAVELLGQAVAALPAGSVQHGWLASRLADARYRTGDQAEAERVAEQALRHAADPDLIVDLHWTLVQCRMRGGSAGDSFTALEQATAGPGIGPKHRARLLVLAARTYLYLGEVESSGREANSALSWATEADDGWATSWALHVLGLRAMIRGDHAGALAVYDRAIAVTETDAALGDLGLLLLINKAVALCNLDRADEALATAARTRELAQQAGTAVRLAQAHSLLGQCLYEFGRWDDALAEIAVATDELTEPFAACCEQVIAAHIAFHRNAPHEGRQHLAAGAALAERFGDLLIQQLTLARSLDREQDGAAPEALEVLTAALRANQGDPGEVEDLFGDAVRLALKTGDGPTAHAVTAQAAALADGSAVPHRQANALYCRGLVDRDPEALLAAAQRYADAGRPLPRAKALEGAAGYLVAADDRTAARLAFEQAVEVYEHLGAEADLNRVQAEFRGHGIRRGPHSKHRRAVSGWDSLTDSELKVAAFVEEGLSNPEIAARLMLSRRTVATHVSHILKKLNVTTRTEVARESALRASGTR
jgi:DNA-binding CsgD family transcriptional regulator